MLGGVFGGGFVKVKLTLGRNDMNEDQLDDMLANATFSEDSFDFNLISTTDRIRNYVSETATIDWHFVRENAAA